MGTLQVDQLGPPAHTNDLFLFPHMLMLQARVWGACHFCLLCQTYQFWSSLQLQPEQRGRIGASSCPQALTRLVTR